MDTPTAVAANPGAPDARAPARRERAASAHGRIAAGTSRDDRFALRKAAEIGILAASLDATPALAVPRDLAEVIAQKLQLASALRAERSLQSWAITETARPEVQHWRCGAYRLSFGYQRADLDVQGPPIYPALDARGHRLAEETIYTGSGMSAIASLLTALLQVRGTIGLLGTDDGYGETRELVERCVERVRVGPLVAGARFRDDAGLRVAWLDSAVPAGFESRVRAVPRRCDLAVVDTTCFWRGSSRLRRLLRWARERDLPLALVRSHAKLDCLGIEYGRMGSIVLAWRRAGGHDFMPDLTRETRNSVRLLGCAAIPAHFPPFSGDERYAPCSAARAASIIRNTRRLARRLESTALRDGVTRYQHGLYLTLAPRGELRIRDVKRAVDGLVAALAAEGLPVRHAGSFGFDFTAVEWFPDASSGRNVIRVAPGDLPRDVVDEIGNGLVRWLAAQAGGRAPVKRTARPTALPRRPANPGTSR